MDLALLDWRRKVADLYRQVRDEPDPEIAHELWKKQRARLLVSHPQSPVPNDVRETYAGPDYYPYDASLRFTCPVRTEIPTRTIAVETGTDGTVRFHTFGRVEIGDLGTLDIWWLDAYGGGVFLPCADHGNQNYGGGRYLLDTVKGADLGGVVDLETGKGSLVIDLNFAYNPSCAYDPKWSCPLAPPENRLACEVAGGEKTPRFS